MKTPKSLEPRLAWPRAYNEAPMWARLRQNHLVVPVLVLLLGIAVAVFTWLTTSRNEAFRRELAFDGVGQRNARRITEAVEERADLLRQVRALYVADGDVGEERFMRFVGELMLTGRTKSTSVVMFAVPREGGIFADVVMPARAATRWSGVDMLADVAFADALERSLTRADITASAPISTGTGDEDMLTLLAVPVFKRPGAAPSEARGSEVVGYLVAIVSVDALLDDAFADIHALEDVRHHAVSVTDVSDTSAAVPFASFGAEAIDATPATREVIHVFDRSWSVDTKRVTVDEQTISDFLQRPSTTLSACIFLVVTLCAHIAYALNRQRALVQKEVESRTSELRQKNLLLERHERELAKVNLKLLEQSHTDPLTELMNRRGFEEHLEQERQRTGRTGVPYGLLIFDVDNFKSFNDHYGHVAGDEVLKRVAHIIYGEARRIDCVARFGGEEFVILASATDAVGLLALGERVRERIQEAAIPHVKSPLEVVTVSGGGALSKVDAEHDPKPVLEIADRCLYEAKATGKNRVVMRM